MAHRYLLLAFCLLTGVGSVCAQASTGYKDFALRGNDILLLTNDGRLKLVNEAVGDSGRWIPTDTPVVAMSLDRQGHIIAGDTAHRVNIYDDQQNTWHPFAHYTGRLTGLVLNSQNRCFLLTDGGIAEATKDRVYLPDSSFNRNKQYRRRYSRFRPTASFIDHSDQLWLGFDFGEWGGDVFCFDTRQCQFVQLHTDSIRVELNPVSAFCDDLQRVYMSSGLSHMFLTHGSIIQFQSGTARLLLQSKDRKTPIELISTDPVTGQQQTKTGFTWKGGQQIGPIAYNPANNCLYFYSQDGIFKGDLANDLSAMQNWQNVLKPELQWTSGRPNAVGPAMNVLKIQFTPSGKLIFLTQHNGLGIFDDTELRFIP